MVEEFLTNLQMLVSCGGRTGNQPLFTISWKSLHITGRLPCVAAAAAVGCRGARPSVLFFSQPGLAQSPHTVPSQGPWDNIGGGGASGALIGTNPDVVQGEPAAVLIQSALVSKTHSHRFKL